MRYRSTQNVQADGGFHARLSSPAPSFSGSGSQISNASASFI